MDKVQFTFVTFLSIPVLVKIPSKNVHWQIYEKVPFVSQQTINSKPASDFYGFFNKCFLGIFF